MTKQAIINAQAQRVPNAMHNAFLNIQVVDAKHVANSKIVSDILNSAKRNTGNPPAGRGWTADVSVKTLKALQQQGVFG